MICVAVNYVAISDALGVSSSVLAAGLAADNVICAVYFTTLFALASNIPAESSTSVDGARNSFYLFMICLIEFYFFVANELLVRLSYIRQMHFWPMRAFYAIKWFISQNINSSL